MTTDAVIMMIITIVGYVGGFGFCLSKVFKKDKAEREAANK